MKIHTSLLVILFSILSHAQNNFSDFIQKSDTFFKTYVSEGRVNYDQLSVKKEDLEKLINLSNQINVPKNNPQNYQAFWINVYNLGVIEQIIEHYPVKSPMQIPGFFNKNKRQLGGQNITLNDLENKLLRGQFDEPRFHFVLVCGAISCPPIVNFAYTPSLLEKQMETQTQLAMNNVDFIQTTEGKTQISEIFRWYAADFGNSKTNISAFINKYRTQKISKDFGYYTYDWQLNKQNRPSDNTNTSTPLSNVQTFTPSKLLAKGQFDVKLFNSLYTQTEQTFGDSSDSRTIPRESFFTSTFELYFGVTDNARINIGFITQARSNTYGDSNAFSVFGFKNKDDGSARTGITTIAPSIRIQPIPSIPTFSFTSSVYFPIFEKEQPGFLDKNSIFWETKLFFDHTFGGNKWQIFTQTDFGFNFGDDTPANNGETFANNSLSLPISAFLSYFPTSKSTIFVNAQQFWLIDLGNDFEQNYTSVGMGAKYQITPELNLEASASKFVRGFNFQGLGQTFGIGLRYLSPN